MSNELRSAIDPPSSPFEKVAWLALGLAVGYFLPFLLSHLLLPLRYGYSCLQDICSFSFLLCLRATSVVSVEEAISRHRSRDSRSDPVGTLRGCCCFMAHGAGEWPLSCVSEHRCPSPKASNTEYLV